MKYKNVVWDWNGTLLDDAGISVATLNAMLARRGLPTITTERYREIFGFPVKGYYEYLGFDFRRDDWDGISREYVEEYDSRTPGVALTSGVREVLAGLRARGTRQFVLSALQQDLLEGMLERFGIRLFFDGVYGAMNIYADGKVERGRQLVAETGVAPGETLMVGDTLHDAEVAEALGFGVCLYSGGHNSRERLRTKGMVIDRMADLLSLA